MEVYDLKYSNSQCGTVPDVEVASAFLTSNTFNGKVVICGGDETEGDCNTFNPDNQLWESFAPLIYPREMHASVQLAEDSFWILGKYFVFPTRKCLKYYNTLLYSHRRDTLWIWHLIRVLRPRLQFFFGRAGFARHLQQALCCKIGRNSCHCRGL